ncbi:MAG: molecular chaperone TorD family protein [Pseudorhodobacter sp.]|nr:molecular chaperone TorD family protein [Pseudorhodobacter sp.]
MFHYGRMKSSAAKMMTSVFMPTYGSATIGDHTAMCEAGKWVAQELTWGAHYDNWDFDNTRFVLNFGSNVFEAHTNHTAVAHRLTRALVQVFRRPLDEGQIARLRDPAMLAALSAAGADPGPAFATQPADALRHALAVDDTQLFHSPANSGDRISLYEGLFTDAEDELNQGRADTVRHFMGDVGFEVVAGSGEMADHISVELAFLAELTAREAEALATGNAARAAKSADLARRFLAAHPGQWADTFARRVEARAQTGFYRAMVGLLQDLFAPETAVA